MVCGREIERERGGPIALAGPETGPETGPGGWTCDLTCVIGCLESVVGVLSSCPFSFSVPVPALELWGVVFLLLVAVCLGVGLGWGC